MRVMSRFKCRAVKSAGFIAIIVFLLILGNYTPESKPYVSSGLITGSYYLASVSIMSQSECIIYEDDGTGKMNDFVFQIGPIGPDGNWYSYNGTYGGIQAGYDTGTGSDNKTQTFTIKNMGTITVDITMASSDFDNALKNDGNYIDIDQTDGNFQIYIPGIGWKNVPDNDDKDDDESKETAELCVADNLAINDEIKGIDFQIRSPEGLDTGNYTAKITFTSYDSTKINPCSGSGTYVIP